MARGDDSPTAPVQRGHEPLDHVGSAGDIEHPSSRVARQALEPLDVAQDLSPLRRAASPSRRCIANGVSRAPR
jgi:hypothetical protein